MQKEKSKGFWKTIISLVRESRQGVVASASVEPVCQEPAQNKPLPIPEMKRAVPVVDPVPELPKEQPEQAKPAAHVYKEKVYKVTGMSHYMEGIMELAEENDNYDLKKKELIEYEMVDERVWKYDFSPTKAELVPEPDNPEDPKAIKVLVDGIHVGYIKAGSCAHLLKVIREDRIVKIECKMYGGPYKYVSEEWDDEKDKFIYEFEKSEVSYGITLTITEK